MWVIKTTATDKETLSMTTATDLLGGGQALPGLRYDAQVLFAEHLNDERIFHVSGDSMAISSGERNAPGEETQAQGEAPSY